MIVFGMILEMEIAKIVLDSQLGASKSNKNNS
jgi:hypothetical protein